MSQTRSPDGLDVDTIEISREGKWFVASAKGTNIASQGETLPEALTNLAEALQLHEEGVPDDIEAPEPDVPWFDE